MADGSLSFEINITAAIAGIATADAGGTDAVYETADGRGKIIDCSGDRSDLVVLGKALVLPSSHSNVSRPLDGSLRFHDLTGWPQVWKNNAWYTLGAGSGGSGGGTSLEVNQFTLAGRTDVGAGPPQEITVGAGLYIYDGVLRSTTLGGSGRLATSGAVSGKLNDAEIIPLGIVPFSYSVSTANSYARAISPATALTVMVLKKKSGQNTPTIVGFFTWEAGATDAVVSIISPALAELDMVFVEGSTNADVTLSDFTFLIRS